MRSFPRLEGVTKARKVSLVLAATSIVCLVAAFLVGISDNRLGITLCYMATTIFTLALVHSWRRTRNFLILFGAGLVGFPVFAVLHNVFYALAEIAKDVAIVHHSMEFLHAAFFIIAIMVCPPAVGIGAVGGVVVAVLHRRGQRRIGRDNSDV